MKIFALETLFRMPWRASTKQLFAIAFVTWLLAKDLSLLPFFEMVWGGASLIPRSSIQADSPLAFALNLLQLGTAKWLAPIFLFLKILACVAFLFWKRSPCLAAVIAILSLNLNRAAYLTLDGGDNLSEIFMVFLPFICMGRRGGDSSAFSIRNTLSNTALLVCQAQVCLVYLTAGLCKIQGKPWQDGTALYYVLQNLDYSMPFVSAWAVRLALPLSLASHATVVFQLLFPAYIWNRAWRPLLIAFGILLHGGIIIGMGLGFFGMIMILSYLLFLDEGSSEVLLRSFSNKSSITVGFDRDCRMCMKFSKFCIFIVGISGIKIDSAVDPCDPHLSAIPKNLRFDSMHAVSYPSSQVTRGFAAIVAIFLVRWWTLPIAMPLVLVKHIGIGDFIYRLAQKARSKQGCGSDACSFKERPST